jgi:hypothetical protein
MKYILGVAALAVALAGCHTTGQKITRLDLGSRPDQVIAMLGKPDKVHTDVGFEVYTYGARHRDRHSIRRTDYTVIFKHNRLVEFGPGQAKREGTDDMVIVPSAP